MSNSKRIEELVNLINYHNDLYWKENKPEISDIEFDNLIRELESLDPENVILNSFGSIDSSSNQKKIVHKHQMLSLGKVYSKEELLKWMKKIARNSSEKFLIQPKYDGISGKIEDGILSSRGDGKIGIDYSDKLPLIKFESKNVNNKFLLGEIVITDSDFEETFQNVKTKSGTPFKNQRNAVAGIMGTDDTDFYLSQNAKLTFVDYDLNSFECTIKDVEQKWEDYTQKILSLGYPLDGIVIKLFDKEYSVSLGNTTHHPRGQIAFKFTNISATSKLIDVEFSMGKEQLAAVGIIEPVEMSGVTVKRVKLQMTKPVSSSVNSCLVDGSLQIGDTVIVERAGDIIPHIVSSSPGANRKRVEIDLCPFCGEKLVTFDTSVQCLNPDCQEKIIQKLYFSLVTLGFKNVGEAYVRKLVSTLNISKLSQIFQLEVADLKDAIFGDKIKMTFFSELEKARNASPENFLVALNIDSLGKNAAKLLLKHFDFEDIITGNISSSKLLNIHGIGHITANDIANNLKKSEVLEEIAKLAKLFNFICKEESKNSATLGTICFTGKMTYKRSEMEAIAKELGFEPVDAAGKDLTILVCADPNSGSSKLQKARKNGTKILGEAEFLAMANK
jgi:DNA ligase (NAD+)